MLVWKQVIPQVEVRNVSHTLKSMWYLLDVLRNDSLHQDPELLHLICRVQHVLHCRKQWAMCSKHAVTLMISSADSWS